VGLGGDAHGDTCGRVPFCARCAHVGTGNPQCCSLTLSTYKDTKHATATTAAKYLLLIVKTCECVKFRCVAKTYVFNCFIKPNNIQIYFFNVLSFIGHNSVNWSYDMLRSLTTNTVCSIYHCLWVAAYCKNVTATFAV